MINQFKKIYKINKSIRILKFYNNVEILLLIFIKRWTGSYLYY